MTSSNHYDPKTPKISRSQNVSQSSSLADGRAGCNCRALYVLCFKLWKFPILSLELVIIGHFGSFQTPNWPFQSRMGGARAPWRLRLLLVLLVSLSAVEGGVGSRRAKRRNTWYEASVDTFSKILTRARETLELNTPVHVYHMDRREERTALIDALWSDALLSVGSRFTDSNPQLNFLLEGQLLDGSNEPTRFHQLKEQSRFEAVMSALFRARSQKVVPLETAALSVMWLYHRVPHAVWDGIGYFTRAVMSHTWTATLCDEAVERDPGPGYTIVEGISAAVFDNLAIRVDYGSYATANRAGRKIEMTNWASLFLPASAMPASFNIDHILGAGGIFKVDLGIEAFLDLFSPFNPEIVQDQSSRWIRFMDDAVNSRLWGKFTPVVSPYPRTKFHFHEPIFDRLQSSYDDVNFELDVMRGNIYHAHSDALMLGGDGLSYMRLIHRLSQDPRLFLETKPLVIPRMGENPHGLYHFMHGDWRMWEPLLTRLALVINNRQVKADPTIVDFNTHQHFLRIVTIAVAEYVAEISATGTSYTAVGPFRAAADANLSFSYLVNFLYLFAFKYLTYKIAVRANDSKRLDRLWRENLHTTRAGLANKTNYRQMSVILVYWGVALVEPLQSFYHNTRCIYFINSFVGWDMPIEKLNLWIKESVVANISEWQIIQFIRRVNFMQHVYRVVKQVIHRFRTDRTAAQLKDVRRDVEMIKEFLRTHIGTTFAQATAPSDANLLGVEMADWGGLRFPRGRAPWNQIADHYGSYRDYVRRQVAKICPWHQWQ